MISLILITHARCNCPQTGEIRQQMFLEGKFNFWPWILSLFYSLFLSSSSSPFPSFLPLFLLFLFQGRFLALNPWLFSTSKGVGEQMATIYIYTLGELNFTFQAMYLPITFNLMSCDDIFPSLLDTIHLYTPLSDGTAVLILKYHLPPLNLRWKSNEMHEIIYF